jgi:hypothetical protein
VLALAGCASAINGTGSGSAPAPATSTPVTSSSPTVSSSPPVSISPLASASSSPLPSSTGAPPSLRRDIASTAVGDPLTVDYCRGQGTQMLVPIGYRVEFSPVQYVGGCTWRLREHNQTRIDVTEYVNPVSTAPKPVHSKHRTVDGLRVDVEPLNRDTGVCVRYVNAAGVIASVEAYAIGVPVTSPRICAAADRVTSTTAGLLGTSQPPRLALLPETVTTLDMCRVADSAHLTRIAPLTNATVRTNNFGADCELSNSSVVLYADTAISRPAAEQNHNDIQIGSHDVLASKNNSASFCSFTARQAPTGTGTEFETIEFSMNAQNVKHPPPHLCRSTAPIVASFLDAGGLR